MKNLITFYHTQKKHCYLAAGLLLSCLFMIPFLLLGTGSIVTYHDQLDGEILNYILAAKYLFTDIRVYPEIMNGLPAAGAVVPAPFFVLLYVLFKPFTAFMFTQWILYLVSFLGMYFLLLKLTKHEFISFSVSVIFMLLPFYPVYGLCIPGQPMLLYAVLSLSQEEHSKYRSVLNYILILFYGVSSSLVLGGYACLLVLGLFAAVNTIAALRRKQKIPFSPWLSLGILLVSYIVTNFSLIRQVLFPDSTYISHKAELVISASEPAAHFKEVLTNGVSYAQSYHAVLFILIALSFIISLFRFAAKKETSESRHLLHKAIGILLFILTVCLFSAFYQGNLMTAIRNDSDGILKTFNLDRVCWLLPAAWCILAGYLLSYIAALRKNASHAIILAVLGFWGITVLLHCSLRPNISKLLKGTDYYALDWNCFFAEDIFSQIKTAIGDPQESYRVVSVGIYPAAAAYNGFYCLDGYSNNYPLSYKHTFRRIIEGELNKNEYIRVLFDNWGNRCYITTAEQANYYTFEKKWNNVIYDLDLNTDVLKEMNCQYVFSAAYLLNAEEKGLSLLQEAPFETENSWYHIYVYALD